MNNIYDYEMLLKRVRDAMPTATSTHERFQIPEADLMIEGKNTIFRNFLELSKKLDRDSQHIAKYLFRELGTPGTIHGDRLIFKSRVSFMSVKMKVNDYIKTYLLCYECGSPDTELRKEDRIEILVCKACGAFRPVTAKIEIHTTEEKIEEGKVYELEISDLSRDGDGIARKGQYIIYVPGSKKGQKVKVKIEKIKKNIGFGTVAK